MPSFEWGDNLVRLPQRQTKKSCGYDFFLPNEIRLEPLSTITVDSKVKAKLEAGEFLLLKLRSSFCDRLTLLGGVIDADFDETIKLVLENKTKEEIVLPKLTRVVQGIILKHLIADDDDCRYESRKGGFGSTGKGNRGN